MIKNTRLVYFYNLLVMNRQTVMNESLVRVKEIRNI